MMEHWTIPPELRRGEGSPWRFEDTTYNLAHVRVKKLRGKASEYSCVDCGGPAEDWSYQGGSPREQLEQQRGCLLAFSSDPFDYDPRCKLCHKTYDNRDR